MGEGCQELLAHQYSGFSWETALAVEAKVSRSGEDVESRTSPGPRRSDRWSELYVRQVYGQSMSRIGREESADGSQSCTWMSSGGWKEGHP
jgi:hypothetical protein